MKIRKILIISLLIIICAFSNLVYATFNINQANLYSKGRCQALLRNSQSGGEIIVTKVFYKNEGKEYPAYCLNVELGGVGEYGEYSVSINEAVKNQLVWRVITNGYPYKSIESLGLANEDEAYTATKQAVYCVLYDYDQNDFEKYVPIGEAGQRTLNAMKNIVSKARNSNDTKEDAQIRISSIDEWKLEKDKAYVSKNFKISSECNIKDYKITIIGENDKDIKMTKNKQNEFKIIMPVKLLEKDGKFEINVEGNLETKPVLYGKASDSNRQDYALAGEMYEGGSGNLKVDYHKNKSKLIIIKKDKTEDKRLEGVKFKITNEKGEITYKDITTNKNGEIIIEGILPGKYYLEEVESIDGYQKIENKIEFDIDLNEEVKVSVTNEKVEKPKEEKTKEESPEREIEILPVTGM